MAKKKNTRKQAIAYADKQMSLYIRARDRRCVICGKTAPEVVLTNGHLITRGKHATRWKEENCYCQCTGCNMRHEHQPEIFTSWWIERHSAEEYQAMVLESNTIRKFPIAEIREIGEMYRDKYKEIQNEGILSGNCFT